MTEHTSWNSIKQELLEESLARLAALIAERNALKAKNERLKNALTALRERLEAMEKAVSQSEYVQIAGDYTSRAPSRAAIVCTNIIAARAQKGGA